MMENKVILVTGATDGIGEVAARELARQGATVVIVSRTQAKLEHTVSSIQQETGNENVSWIQADLSSMADVRRTAEEFLQRHDRLDVLLNNVGANFTQRYETVDGYEKTLALNHLSYFLLTHLLLDTLKKTAAEQGEARIINVSSSAHRGSGIDFDNLQRQKGFNPLTVYGQTKLMNILFTYALDRRLEGTNVTVNALHPGFVNTNFGNDGGFVGWMIGTLQNLFALSPDEGAQTSVYLASSPDVKGVSGKYWAEKQQRQSSAASYDRQAQERLWTISEELVGLHEASASTTAEKV